MAETTTRELAAITGANVVLPEPTTQDGPWAREFAQAVANTFREFRNGISLMFGDTVESDAISGWTAPHRHDSYIDIAVITTPDPPAAGYIRLYAVDDAGTPKLAYERPDATEVIL